MVTEVKYEDFENNIGKIVKIKGKVATAIWQHLIIQADGYPYMNYIDLDENYQIVVYSKSQIVCENDLEMIGEVLKVKGGSKDPRSKIHDDIYYEFQFNADSWKCFEQN